MKSNVAAIVRKGAKGISLFGCFDLDIINMMPMVDPVNAATARTVRILCQRPKKSPIKIINLVSPNPIDSFRKANLPKIEIP